MLSLVRYWGIYFFAMGILTVLKSREQTKARLRVKSTKSGKLRGPRWARKFWERLEQWLRPVNLMWPECPSQPANVGSGAVE